MEAEHPYLHDREKPLCEVRSSGASLAQSLMIGLGESLLADLVVCIFLAVVLFLSFQSMGYLWIYGIVCTLIIAAVEGKRWRVWNQARFRVTSERILLQHPIGLTSQALQTVKWPQYQESHTGNRTFFDFLFGARPLCIRFGTADAQKQIEICFPSLRYGHDLKHYLDKVDSAYRQGQVLSVPAFVEAPRGKRDGVPPAIAA